MDSSPELVEEIKRFRVGFAYLMDVMYSCAAKSNDPDTHIGAVIVRPEFNKTVLTADLRRSIVSTGCNHFPRNIKITPAMLERPEKHLWTVHAETDAICCAARYGGSLQGCHLFTNGLPCSECAKVIVESGIASIYIDRGWESFGDPGFQKTWAEKFRVSRIMLDAANIPVIPIPYLHNICSEVRRVPRFKRGQWF
ncbi:MAG: deaminase [Patescibacteria group bacterium]